MALPLLLLGATLLGCEPLPPPIESGTVVDREFVPMSQQLTFGLDGNLHPIVVPAACYVTIEATGDDGQVRRRRIEVPSATFDRLRTGDDYSVR